MNMIEYAMGGGSLFMLFFWGLIIAVIFLLLSGMSRRNKQNSDGESAGDILKKKFARGEIDAAQYQEMKRLLSDGS